MQAGQEGAWCSALLQLSISPVQNLQHWSSLIADLSRACVVGTLLFFFCTANEKLIAKGEWCNGLSRAELTGCCSCRGACPSGSFLVHMEEMMIHK